MKRLLLAMLALSAALAGARAQGGASADVTARFLAGLPVRGTALEAPATSAAWVDHALFFDEAWAKVEHQQLAPIRSWIGEFLPNAGGRSPVFYMFSGPDFLYAQAFFPNADQYILCGTEPIGVVPDISTVAPEALGSSLANLRKSLDSVLNFSFFITKDMRVDLRQSQLSGTLPILMVFLARTGCQIHSVEEVTVGKSARGVRIAFTGAAGRPQTLSYFSTDLSDGAVNRSGFLSYCAEQGEGRSLLKAASYLMHGSGFETVRKFILNNSSVIVQDDSGIPLQHFDPARWRLRLFGRYRGPIELFAKHDQPALASLYAGSNAPALPFGFGYQWHRTNSTLMVATPR